MVELDHIIKVAKLDEETNIEDVVNKDSRFVTELLAEECLADGKPSIYFSFLNIFLKKYYDEFF
jgi:hypothetical protein